MPEYPLIGGPFDGKKKFLVGVVPELEFWLKADGSLDDDFGDIAQVASYLPEGAGDDVVYKLHRLDDSGPVLDRVREVRADDPRRVMTRKLYEKPNYEVYSVQPSDAHPQVELKYEHRFAEVDERIAPLVLEVWKRGWETMGSCQERPPESPNAGWAYLDFPAPKHGRAFVEAMAAAGIQTKDGITELAISGRGPDRVLRCYVVGKLLVYLLAADIERAAAFLRR